MDTWTMELEGAEATLEVGQRLGETLPAGACIALMGDLGAGKTTFVRGLAEGLGIDTEDVASPTYTLMTAHDGGRLPLYHFDAWMEGREKALLAGGGDEDLARGDGVSVVEWAARVEPWLPSPRLAVTLEHVSLEARRIRIERVGTDEGPLGEALGEALRALGTPA